MDGFGDAVDTLNASIRRMNNMSVNPNEMLEKVILKIDELRAIEKEEKDNLNILSILEKESDEVYMCRVLWAILDHADNGRRNILSGFIKSVLKLNIDENEINQAIVYREYCIPQNNRRIDIVIKTPNIFIPIEAKIYAGDQENQCADYLEYAGNYYSEPQEAILFYLTKDKHKPSYYSISNNKELLNQIKLISWKDILDWLKGMKGLGKNTSETISQYCKALEDLLNVKKGDFNMGIDEMINSSDGMKAAMEIEKSINRKKTALLHTVYEEILERTSKESGFDFDPKLNEPWDYKQAIDEYYSKKTSSSTYPALTFKLALLESLDDGTEYYLILRYEIEWRSYVGIAIMIRDKEGQLYTADNPSEELVNKARSLISDSSQISAGKSWWLYWEYVCSNSSKAVEDEPNFRTMNESYLSLFDENGRKKYVDQVMDLLKKFRKNII